MKNKIKKKQARLQNLSKISANLLQKLKEYREKRIIKKLKTVNHLWWNNVDEPTEPLTKEVFEKIMKDYSRKPPNYIYLYKKANWFEKIWKSFWNIIRELWKEKDEKS